MPRSASHSWISATRFAGSTLTRGECSGQAEALRASTVTPVVTCSRVSRVSWSSSFLMRSVVREGHRVSATTHKDLGDLLLEVLPPDGRTIGDASARGSSG